LPNYSDPDRLGGGLAGMPDAIAKALRPAYTATPTEPWRGRFPSSGRSGRAVSGDRAVVSDHMADFVPSNDVLEPALNAFVPARPERR
jgi:hypothetical protein